MNGSSQRLPLHCGARRRSALLIAAMSAVSIAGMAMSADARQNESARGGESSPSDGSERASVSAPSTDGLVYLEADEVFADQETGEYIARGMVEVRYGSRTLRAEEVIVNPAQGRVLARGGITIIDDSGIITYADRKSVV